MQMLCVVCRLLLQRLSVSVKVATDFALSLTLFSLNFLGDGFRDALDPRIAKD